MRILIVVKLYCPLKKSLISKDTKDIHQNSLIVQILCYFKIASLSFEFLKTL
jgi:hypothetical protein